MLCDLRDKAEPVKGCLVNGPHLVEDERAGQQHRQRQQLHGILRTLQDRTQHDMAGRTQHSCSVVVGHDEEGECVGQQLYA